MSVAGSRSCKSVSVDHCRSLLKLSPITAERHRIACGRHN
jgi:hypothetical protein